MAATNDWFRKRDHFTAKKKQQNQQQQKNNLMYNVNCKLFLQRTLLATAMFRTRHYVSYMLLQGFVG